MSPCLLWVCDFQKKHKILGLKFVVLMVGVAQFWITVNLSFSFFLFAFFNFFWFWFSGSFFFLESLDFDLWGWRCENEGEQSQRRVLDQRW